MDIHKNEKAAIAAGRGNWSPKSDVPHRGWECVQIEDLGAPSFICEMCKRQKIRYVHYMEHSEHPDILKVGCICAGHMEEDLVAAKKRDAAMKSRAVKRKQWFTRKWRTSAKGNPWVVADGYRVSVYKRGGGWAATIASEDDSLIVHSRFNHGTQDKAKLSAFDYITKLLARDS